jgi:two-component system phosphate regulon sensor histidine kinase PhoR
MTLHERQQRTLAEANLQIILASMQDGVLVADSRRTVRLVNPSLRKLLQIEGDVFARPAMEVLREPDIDSMIARALESGEEQENEVETIRDGTSIVIVVTVSPMRDAAGEPGALVLVRDVTRLTRLEHVRRDFVSNVSHELRTPLAIFQGWVETLQDNPDMPREDQATAFSVLRKHSARLNALVEDLLTLARLEGGHEEMNLQPMSVGAFFEELKRDWTPRVAGKDVRLRLRVEAELPQLNVDRLRFEQVFTNLLDNAFKFTPKGGEIVLGAKRDGDFVEMWVKDSGPGILSTDLAHIFERFYRADKARSREHGGTGLGLSIVKHIVKAHGGNVSASSEFGWGTTIHVRLPAA